MNEFTNPTPTYDEVVGSLLSNVLVEQKRCGKIILWDFNPVGDYDKLYFNIAAIVSDMSHQPIYLNMGLIDYLMLKWKFRKKRKNLRYIWIWNKKTIPIENQTSVYILVDFVREFYNVSPYFMKEINDTYYGWVQ